MPALHMPQGYQGASAVYAAKDDVGLHTLQGRGGEVGCPHSLCSWGVAHTANGP